MKNYFGTKTNNILINKLSTINLTALSAFLIYFFSITLAPIVNGVISARHNNLFIGAQNKNFNLQAQILKLKTNSANIVTTATYINNGQMLARQIDNNNLQNYVNDAKGSVLKLNNSNGSNNQNYSYDAYGNIITAAATHSFQKTFVATNPIIAQGANAQRGIVAAAIINPFQYNGERMDANTALQYLRTRFYNPETKRFINQDTYNLLNKFGYVDGNPIMGIDPSGHNAVSDWFKDHWQACIFIAGVAGIAIGIGTGTSMGMGRGYFAAENRKLRSENKKLKLMIETLQLRLELQQRLVDDVYGIMESYQTRINATASENIRLESELLLRSQMSFPAAEDTERAAPVGNNVVLQGENTVLKEQLAILRARYDIILNDWQKKGLEFIDTISALKLVNADLMEGLENLRAAR